MLRRPIFILLSFILVFSFALTGCSKPAPKTNSTPKGMLKLGAPTVVLTQSVSPSGATLTVNRTDSVINGLQLVVPANSYADSRQFKISSAPVLSQTFGSSFSPISPLISIDNGGRYANEIITLQIPVQIPAGNFAMAFYYDAKNGRLEGIPTIAENASSITIVTRHFSDIVVSATSEASLGTDVELDTGFSPGVDDWQFTNYGSYIAPGGHCAGQSITALWYYSQMKSAGEPSLYGRYDEGTRDFWYDDARAYRFASTIQKDVDWAAWGARYNKLKPKAQNDNSLVWKQFVYSMKVTGDPQFIYIQNTAGEGAHAMIVYAISGGALQIADPNYPGSLDREIWYDEGEFDPYNSGANAQAILNGHGISFDLMLYFGTSSLIDFEKVSSRWGEFADRTIGNDRFPAYIIQIPDENGDLVALQDGYTTKEKKIDVYLTADVELTMFVIRDEQTIASAQGGGVSVPLKPGNNELGFYVVKQIDSTDSAGKPSTQYQYVDFKYFNVKTPEPTSASGTASKSKPVVTSFNGPNAFQFDSSYNVIGLYKFSVSVEGGSPPYYYTWIGSRAPQVLQEGNNLEAIEVSPQYMRQPGAIKDGFFLWVTVKDSKGQYATWGNGSTEFMYGVKFTGRFEVKNGVVTLVENTWAVVTEP